MTSPAVEAVQPPLALEPMILPDPIDWWPLAWGWWAVLLVVTGTVIGLAIWGWHQWQRRAPIRRARQQLAYHFQQAEHATDESSQHFIQHCNTVMKQVCLHYHPYASSLSGGAWLAFLRSHSQPSLFDDEYGRVIAHGIYQAQCHYDKGELYRRTDQWLKQLSLRVSQSSPSQSSPSHSLAAQEVK